MSWFQNQSLRIKLIILIMMISMIVVALMSGARIIWDLRQEKVKLHNEITTLTELLGNRSSAALAFRDNRLAFENLSVLEDLPHVIKGCLYFSDGELASAFSRVTDGKKCPKFSLLNSEYLESETDLLGVIHPVYQDERYLGSIYILSDFSPLEQRIRGQLIFGGIAIVVSLLLSSLLAGILQKLISGPVEEVTQVARAIRKGKDQTLRAKVTTEDEIGELAENFNSMLDTLQTQSMELEHARAEQTTLLSKYRDLFDSASDSIFLIDAETLQFIDVNPVACKAYGYSCDEMLNMNLKQIIAPKPLKHFSDLVQKVRSSEGSSIFEDCHIDRQGKDFPVEVSARLVTLENRQVFLAFVRDITERKLAEEKIRQLSEVVEQSPNSVVITDTAGKIVYVNPAFISTTGYAMEEVIGHNPRLLKSDQVPESVYQDLWLTISTGDTWHGELVNRKKDGSLFLEEQTIKPMIGTDGKITHFVAINQDVTERRQTEDALRRAQKMEAVGHLAGGIAHDFNNQLGVVVGYLDFLDRHLKEDAKAHEWVNTATRATLRCVDLVRQLLVFSRRQGKEQGPVNINHELINMDKLIERSVTPAITVTTQLADDLKPVIMDAGEFQDCILNLVINARDAMPEGGKLLIKTENVDSGNVAALNERSPGWNNYVRIVVNDTGEGMSEAVQEHAFEPFFTTKSIGEGTGLGLAMVYGFVERYKGRIEVQSEMGKGTSFEIYFPVAESADMESQVDRKLPLAKTSQGESVLVVDDEIDLLNLADEYLQSLGYHSFRAQSASEALKMLHSGIEVDVLFSDVVMPGGINGFELAEQVKREFPHIRVLLTSGFTSDTLKQKLADASMSILQKPYRKETLAQHLRELIEPGEVA